jgi:hypothetical protein
MRIGLPRISDRYTKLYRWYEYRICKRCHLCGRPLNNSHDPFSLDCGGDCLGCMLEIEQKMGWKDL